MLDMMVLAFWTDTTRNITFMFANDVSPRNFSFLEGVRENHHSSSHHANQQAKIDSYKMITRWHVEQFAYLLTRPALDPGRGTTLLDNSMIMCGSSLSDGNRHDPNNLPILLGGKGGGRIQSRPAPGFAAEHAAVQPLRLDAGLHGGSRCRASATAPSRCAGSCGRGGGADTLQTAVPVAIPSRAACAVQVQRFFQRI